MGKALDRKAKKLEKRLELVGIQAIKFYPSSHFCDPLIQITDSIHIQVGFDYIAVVRVSENGLCHLFETSNSVDSIMKSLKEASK